MKHWDYAEQDTRESAIRYWKREANRWRFLSGAMLLSGFIFGAVAASTLHWWVG